MQNRSGKKKKSYAFASKVIVGNPKAKRPGISGRKGTKPSRQLTKSESASAPGNGRYLMSTAEPRRALVQARSPGKSTSISPPAWVLENRDPTRAEGKGVKGGLCNMRSCLKPGAFWYNQGSHAYYCEETAHMLNSHNDRSWRRDFPGQGDHMCFDDTEGTVVRHVSG